MQPYTLKSCLIIRRNPDAEILDVETAVFRRLTHRGGRCGEFTSRTTSFEHCGDIFP